MLTFPSLRLHHRELVVKTYPLHWMSAEMKKADPDWIGFCVLRGGSPRNRTLNLRIKSPLLYQLS